MPEQLALDWTLDPLEARVLCTLSAHRGRAAAIRVPDLAALAYGMDYHTEGHAGRKTLERMLQAVVKRLREEHGQPILSSAGKPAGYYLAETAAELEQCVAEQRRKAIHTLTMLRALKRHLARLRGQQAFGGTTVRQFGGSGTVEPSNPRTVEPPVSP